MIDRIRIEPGHRPKLAERDTRDTLGLEGKEAAKEELAELVARLAYEDVIAETSTSWAPW